MSEIDQQFVEYVVKSLVGKPDAVKIERRIDEKGVLLELTVDPDDLGRVIGKRGATAQSLRTLLRALGTKNDARYNLKIIDNGPMDRSNNRYDSKPNATESENPQATDNAETSESESTKDEAKSDESEVKPEKSEELDPEPDKAAKQDDQATDRLAQTRKELADLDDLDV
ncbi:MAG TPA: KH domain-containing protein [Candidatus Saccharimonadales bacterium]|nr:KH domain-containing protein [Candidatus Saccharimonadales bacterium]